MTKQVVIKLNEKKFKPLIDSIQDYCGTSKSYSEFAGKCIFQIYSQVFHKIPELDGKTMFEFLAKGMGKSFDEGHMDFLRRYTEFMAKDKNNVFSDK